MYIKSILFDQFDTEEWTALEHISNEVKYLELKVCHNIILPDINLVDFITNYRKVFNRPNSSEKKMSVQLFKLLLYYINE
jgi:hypothetical protein